MATIIGRQQKQRLGFALWRATGKFYDSGHGMAVRRKGEEQGTSAISGKHCGAQEQAWACGDGRQAAAWWSKSQPGNMRHQSCTGHSMQQSQLEGNDKGTGSSESSLGEQAEAWKHETSRWSSFAANARRPTRVWRGVGGEAKSHQRQSRVQQTHHDCETARSR